MDANAYAPIEMALFFGGLLALGFWQLHSVTQAKKRRLERERAEKAET